MSLKEIFLGGGGLLVVLLTLVEFAPIKINPWSALAKAIGRAVNADVLRELKSVKDDLSDHIRTQAPWPAGRWYLPPSARPSPLCSSES